jgi:hypothetical protein
VEAQVAPVESVPYYDMSVISRASRKAENG